MMALRIRIRTFMGTPTRDRNLKMTARELGTGKTEAGSLRDCRLEGIYEANRKFTALHEVRAKSLRSLRSNTAQPASMQ